MELLGFKSTKHVPKTKTHGRQFSHHKVSSQMWSERGSKGTEPSSQAKGKSSTQSSFRLVMFGQKYDQIAHYFSSKESLTFQNISRQNTHLNTCLKTAIIRHTSDKTYQNITKNLTRISLRNQYQSRKGNSLRSQDYQQMRTIPRSSLRVSKGTWFNALVKIQPIDPQFYNAQE